MKLLNVLLYIFANILRHINYKLLYITYIPFQISDTFHFFVYLRLLVLVIELIHRALKSLEVNNNLRNLESQNPSSS